MNIFISWSGEKAQRVAVGLKDFLQAVDQQINAWFSDTDIAAGGRWSTELASQLKSTDFGIICVTQESIQSPWILFEAGALSTSLKTGRVCPYLIDLNRRQLVGPLAQFQAKEANLEQTWQMLQSIIRDMEAEELTEEKLRDYFDSLWPQLEVTITEVNRDLQTLPSQLRKMLLDSLPTMFYHAADINRIADDTGLSVWKINWNQSAINIWRELIHVASSEHKTLALLTTIRQEYPENKEIIRLWQEVSTWESMLK